ncbi:TetR-like C-terminal domain-containing protein [Holzapfeliella floricola]
MSGLNAVIKQWLANGCQKSPEEIADLLEHNLAKLSE